MKTDTNEMGHMTKMFSRPICGKTLEILLLQNNGLVTVKLGVYNNEYASITKNVEIMSMG